MKMPLRLRLFNDGFESPRSIATLDKQEAELTVVITPYKAADDSADSGFGSESETTTVLQHNERRSTPSRKSLFPTKRPADSDSDIEPPSAKKCRLCDDDSSGVINAVDRLTTQSDLVADGSRTYTLPTIAGKHQDLKSISVDTMTDVVGGRYSDKIDRLTIIDCRYPYEYEGGHIKGALNLYTRDLIQPLLQAPVPADKAHVLIFHCEFSSERGPKMYRFLRSQDREMHKDVYPKLKYPEIYLLHGGYKDFFTDKKILCEPPSYMPMLHEDHMTDLRHFRVKSKSWTAGERRMSSSRQRSRLPRISFDC